MDLLFKSKKAREIELHTSDTHSSSQSTVRLQKRRAKTAATRDKADTLKKRMTHALHELRSKVRLGRQYGAQDAHSNTYVTTCEITESGEGTFEQCSPIYNSAFTQNMATEEYQPGQIELSISSEAETIATTSNTFHGTRETRPDIHNPTYSTGETRPDIHNPTYSTGETRPDIHEAMTANQVETIQYIDDDNNDSADETDAREADPEKEKRDMECTDQNKYCIAHITNYEAGDKTKADASIRVIDDDVDIEAKQNESETIMSAVGTEGADSGDADVENSKKQIEFSKVVQELTKIRKRKTDDSQ